MKLRYIFIPFLIVLLMSHNTFAFDISQLVIYKASDTKPYFRVNFSDGTSSGWTNSNWTNPNNYVRNIQSYQIRSSGNGTPAELQQGRFVTAIIRIGFPGTNNYWNTTGAWSYNADTGNTCQILDVTATESEMHQVNNETWQWANLLVTCKMVADTNYIPIGLTVRTSNFGQTWQTQALGYTIWSPTNPATTSDVQAVQAVVSSLKASIDTKLNNIDDKLQDILDEIGKEEDAANDAVEGSETAGGDSSSDAETATSSLISVIGSFVGAVTTATPTNCRINGDMGNLDVGTIDLCANPVPTFVQIISSLILIAICIPFAIVMFNRFIGLFRSFQE